MSELDLFWGEIWHPGDRKEKGVGNATKGFHWEKKWAHVAICRQ
jgi:hypothetical protein